MDSELCFHSPFTPDSFRDGENRGLLLQFLLLNLISAIKSQKDKTSPLVSSPSYLLDWAQETGRINKLDEHAKFLKHAFPSQIEAVATVHRAIEQLKFFPQDKETLIHLFTLFEPLLISCKSEATLYVFFLTKRREFEACFGRGCLTTLFSKMYPDGECALAEMITTHYRQRGFTAMIPKIEELLNVESSPRILAAR